MNKKLVKRVAVASLAALMTIPSLTTASYALEVTRHADGTYKSASFDNDQEAVEFFKEELAKNGHLYNEFRRKDLQKQLDKYEKRANGGSKNVVDVSAAEAKLAKMEQERLAREAEREAQRAAKKAQEEAKKAELVSLGYGTFAFHGYQEVENHLQKLIPHGSSKYNDNQTVKQYIDDILIEKVGISTFSRNGVVTEERRTNMGTRTYTGFMEKYGYNPNSKSGPETVQDMDFKLRISKSDTGLPFIEDRMPNLKLELLDETQFLGSQEYAIVKATYYSPIDGALGFSFKIPDAKTNLYLEPTGRNFSYHIERDANDTEFWWSYKGAGTLVSKGENVFYMSAWINIPEYEREMPTQEMLDSLVTGLRTDRPMLNVFRRLYPIITHEQYIDD